LNLSDLSQQDQYYDKTDLNIILENVLNDLELVIEEKQAVVTSGPLEVIDAIPMQINQLIFNLINNALKFSRKDVVPRIEISLKPVKNDVISRFDLNPHLSYCQITVQDNGIGFNEEFADKIFLLFQRVHNRQAYSGSGIGLAICKKIVLNHKGEIYAEGIHNEGAAFHVILPRTQPGKAPTIGSEIHSSSRLSS
jgi:two-component system CheB/CheR fusion protein